MFEITLIMFRPKLDIFIDVCGLPGECKNESWHKTDCCHVVLDYKKIDSAIWRRFEPATASAVGKKTSSS